MLLGLSHYIITIACKKKETFPGIRFHTQVHLFESLRSDPAIFLKKKKKKKVVPKTQNTCSLKAVEAGALIGLPSVTLQKHPELINRFSLTLTNHVLGTGSPFCYLIREIGVATPPPPPHWYLWWYITDTEHEIAKTEGNENRKKIPKTSPSRLQHVWAHFICYFENVAIPWVLLYGVWFQKLSLDVWLGGSESPRQHQLFDWAVCISARFLELDRQIPGKRLTCRQATAWLWAHSTHLLFACLPFWLDGERHCQETNKSGAAPPCLTCNYF